MALVCLLAAAAIAGCLSSPPSADHGFPEPPATTAPQWQPWTGPTPTLTPIPWNPGAPEDLEPYPVLSTTSTSSSSASTSASESTTASATATGTMLPPAGSQSTTQTPGAPGPSVAINLVQAFDHGCGTDSFTEDDFQASVWVDGKLAIRAALQDDDDPLFAKLVVLQLPADHVVLQVRLEERDPLWAARQCDLSTTSEGDVLLDWDGSFQTLAFVGDNAAAGELRITMGPAAPTAPPFTLQSAAPDHVTVLAPAGSALHAFGAEIGIAGAGPTQVASLCDGMSYDLRAIVSSGGWSVGTALEAQTTNVAPGVPRVFSATSNGSSLTLFWDAVTPHDAAAYRIYIGPDAEVPIDSLHLVATDVVAGGSARHQLLSIDGTFTGHVRVVTTDQGGLVTAGPSFPIGAPHAGWPPGHEECRKPSVL